jgi:hypothetical protein
MFWKDFAILWFNFLFGAAFSPHFDNLGTNECLKRNVSNQWEIFCSDAKTEIWKKKGEIYIIGG